MLRGKSAVVTGSTSGIGLGIARALAAQHAHIMLNGFGESTAIDALITDLRAQYGVEVDYSSADLSRPEQVIDMVEQCSRRFGGVDILVNNAGIQHTAPVEEFPMEKWEQSLPSTSPRRSTASKRRYRVCGADAGGESSISLLPMGSLHRRPNRRT